MLFACMSRFSIALAEKERAHPQHPLKSYWETAHLTKEVPNEIPTHMQIGTSQVSSAKPIRSLVPSAAPSAQPSLTTSDEDYDYDYDYDNDKSGSNDFNQGDNVYNSTTIQLVPINLEVLFPTSFVVDYEKIKRVCTDFIRTVLSTKAHPHSFKFVDFNTTMDYDAFTRKLEATITGEAFYNGTYNLPTHDGELKDVLMIYFGHWGSQDLWDYLADAEMPAEQVTVEIAGQAYTSTSGLGLATDAALSLTEEFNSTSSGKMDSKMSLIIAVALVVSMVILIALFFIRQQQRIEHLHAVTGKGMAVGEKNNSGTDNDRGRDIIGASSRKLPSFFSGTLPAQKLPPSHVFSRPRPLSPMLPRPTSPSVFSSISGVVSLAEDSMYLSDIDAGMAASALSYQYESYDTSRLDQVISSANGLPAVEFDDKDTASP